LSVMWDTYDGKLVQVLAKWSIISNFYNNFATQLITLPSIFFIQHWITEHK